MDAQLKLHATSNEKLLDSARRTFSSYREGVEQIIAELGRDLGDAICASVNAIASATGRVIVSGMGKSGHIGRKIAATMASTGTPALFVHPSEASHGDLGMITADDVVLALSWSGETAELRELVSYAKRFKIGLIALTANTDSALARAADIVVGLPPIQEACPHNLAPTTSTMIQLAVGDALSIALLEYRGFSAKDFGLLHPAGRLGAMLKLVRDIMHEVHETPIALLGTAMSSAVVEMSAKGYGCVGIIDQMGELVGIITDGDLRRHMSSDLLTKTVQDVMTTNPKTIKPDQLASEALNVMNDMKVGALMVVDAGKPVGILRMHDILRAGVV